MTTLAQFERTHQVRFIRKDRLWEMRFVAWLLNLLPRMKVKKRDGTIVEEERGDRFIQKFWTVYKRWSWGETYLLYSLKTESPMDPSLEWLRDHELVHVEDLRTALGWVKTKTVALLTVWWVGTWYVERHAFLHDFRAGVRTPEQAADLLHQDYGCRVPKPKMVTWWKERLA